MATYTESTFNDVAVQWHEGVIERVFTTTSRTLADGDIVKLCRLPRAAKILGARIGLFTDTNDPTIELRLNDGASSPTTKQLIETRKAVSPFDESSLAGTGALVTEANIGFVTDDGDWWLEFIVDDAAVADAKTFKISIRYTMDLEAGEGIYVTS